MHAWQVSRHTSEPGEHDTNETGGGEREICTGESGVVTQLLSLERHPGLHGLPPREPRGVRTLVPARSDGDHPEEPGVGDKRDKRDKQVCLWVEGEETDQDNDDQASVDPEGKDMQRAVQGGEVHKQQGEGSRHERQKRGAQREGGQERAGGGAHRGLRGDVQDDYINGTARGPAGPCSGDDDTRKRTRRGTLLNGGGGEEVPEEADMRGWIEGGSSGNGIRTRCGG